MGYQALLFCPDEKTARTVTQVLSELDFAVISCTEPFAAVKKLMADHFDAVVVDCDNEQNATLLFKSARNTANNQSSLAVAVVEGQAGVAKAFRIGANLVLTKPINVEQAKGTLRVARGLLRKNEGTKPATPAASAGKPAAPAQRPKPASQAPIAVPPAARPATPAAPPAASATASVLTQRPVAQQVVVASASPEIADEEMFETTIEEPATPPVAKPASKSSAAQIPSSSAAAPEPQIKKETNSSISQRVPSPKPSPTSSTGLGTGSATAPAPARETRPSVSTQDKPSPAVASIASVVAKNEITKDEVPKDEITENTSSPDATSATAPAFTFGGNVDKESASARGSKKVLLAVVAVLLIAALAYAVWMQWVRSSGAEVGPPHVTRQPVKAPAAPAVAPPAASTAAPSTTSPVSPSSVPASTPDSTAAAKASPAVDTTSVPTHTNKSADTVDSLSTPAPKASAAKAPAQPIVIKQASPKPKAKSDDTADVQAPSLAAIPSSGGNVALPNLGASAKAAAPVLETLHISQGVSRGLLVKQVQPSYPPQALHLRIEGSVELLATISKYGDISAVKILSGDPQLARAAADAVKKWKYKAYLLNGEPVEIQTQVTVNFKLPN